MADFDVVVVLDRHQLVAEILASGLQARGHPTVARRLEADTSPLDVPDARVVLLDAYGGWAAVQRWLATAAAQSDPPRVVLITDGAPPTTELTARRAGVWGWFPNRATLGTASTVVSAVLAGRPHFAAHGEVVRVPEQRQPLTSREQQVLAGIAAGVSYAQIAVRLQVSHNTVRTHATSIRTKLGVRNRTAAVAVAHGVRVADGRSPQ